MYYLIYAYTIYNLPYYCTYLPPIRKVCLERDEEEEPVEYGKVVNLVVN
jgi:hypothetical protein